MATSASHGVESRYAWIRLTASVLLSTIGGVGLWSIVVAMPAVQAEFGVDRAGASIPYTVTMLAFGAGGIFMGRLADRFGIFIPVLIGTLALAAGYTATAFAPNITIFTILYGATIGLLGSCALFGPLVADTSLWFDRRRGMAVAVCASGNYFAGAVWPPILQSFIASAGWRQTNIGVGVFCLVTMLPLSLVLRRRSPVLPGGIAAPRAVLSEMPLGLTPSALQALLMIAGLACCVAMAMPQVHIVAYCVDLGYGAARGSEMLSLMLGFGVISRLGFGWVMDRIGGLKTLVLGSLLQTIALALFLPFNGMASLYVLSAVFGLFQGGLVPSYTMIIRRFFPAHETGTRVGLVMSATIAGMAVGGWMSGAIFDATGSYQAALINGILWNVINLSIAVWMLMRARRVLAFA